MLRKIVDFAATKFRRRGMTPDEARIYNGQTLLAWGAHANRGTPPDIAAWQYGVAVADVIAFEILRKYHADELQKNAPLLTGGKITPGWLLKKIGTGEQVAQMTRVRPYRPRPASRVEYLFSQNRKD